MSRLILQPTANKGARKHYRDTVSNSVKIAEIRSFLTPKELDALSVLYPSGRFICWGATRGKNDTNKKQWDKIDTGDTAVFNQDSRFFAKATVTYKSHNRKLAKQLWGVDQDGKTWELMYFLDELQSIDVPYKQASKLLDYKPKNNYQKFNVVDSKRAMPFLRNYHLLSSTYLPKPPSKKEYASILKSIPTTDGEAVVKTRNEQSYLRNLLFKGKSFEHCACCGEKFPVSMLVTAHIKQRSHCSHEERLDDNVVIPMCKFGCDELFERGYVTVDASGKIQGNHPGQTSTVKNRINSLSGLKIGGYSKDNAMYFDWHRNHHKP